MLSFSTVGGEEVKKRKESVKQKRTVIAVCEKKNHYDLFIYRSALNSLYD